MSTGLRQFGPRTSSDLYEIRNNYRAFRGRPYMPSPQDVSAEVRTHAFENVSGEAIPPYACMKLEQTGISYQTNNVFLKYPLALVIKPDGTGGPFLFNGGTEIAIGKTGQYQTDNIVVARNENLSPGNPVPGTIWGPVKDSWAIAGIRSGGDDAKNHDAAVEVIGRLFAATLGSTDGMVLGRVIDTGNLPILFKAPSGGIPARVGTTPGGPVTVNAMRLNRAANAIEELIGPTGTPMTFQVWSWLTKVVSSNGERLGWAQMDRFGVFWSLADDCNDT